MAHTLRCELSGWGGIEDPRYEGEMVDIDMDESNHFTVDDLELAVALVEHEDAIHWGHGESPPDSEPDTETEADAEADESDDEDEDAPTCSGMDGECSREVDEEGDYCWQHPNTDDDES